MTSSIFIQRLESADRRRLFEFLDIAYPGRSQFKHPDRWKWQFEHNPFLDHQQIPVWVARDGDRIVGQTAAQIEPLHGVPGVNSLAWSVDTIVLPEFRGQGLGKQLQLANQQSHTAFASMAMSPPNRHIKQSLGARPLPAMTEMALGSPTGSQSPWRRLSSRFTDKLARHRFNRATRRSRTFRQRIRCEPIKRFGTETDSAWKSIRKSIGWSVDRTSTLLNWKFLEQPFTRFQPFVVRVDSKPCGWFVLRCPDANESPLGIVSDLVLPTDEPHITRAVIVEATCRLDEMGVLSTRIGSSSAMLYEVLESCGFRPLRCHEPLWHQTTPAAGSPETILLTLGDHDLDQFPLRRT